MTGRRAGRASLISPGGVALADILANSVAVILILILATLVYRQEETQKELERGTDITTILARQLATAVVWNDLPSSPPSVLHDYDSCAIPHDCDPMLLPVLELHKGFIRIFNTATRIYRAELLRQQNAFDRYLTSLTPEERAGIRLDIHSITEYYLALGIMQEHGVRPRHWHYLGEDVPPLANLSPLAERVEGLRRPEDAERHAALEDGWGRSRHGRRRGQPEQSEGADLPELEGTSLGGAGVLGALQYDSLLPPAYLEARGHRRGAPNQPFAPGAPRLGGSMLDGQGQAGALSKGSDALRLFIPNAPTGAGATRQLQIPPEDYAEVTLHYLFRLLESARETGAFEPQRQHEWLLQLAQNPRVVLDRQPHQALVQRLLARIAQPPPAAAPRLATAAAPQQPHNRLLLPANGSPGDAGGQAQARTLLLRLGQATPWLDALAGKPAQPQFLMRPHPSLYKGQRLTFLPEHLLLMLPDGRPALGWRPVAVVDPSLEYIALGFVHAGMEGGQLALHAGVNQLRLSGRPAANPRLNDADAQRGLAPSLWALALLALAVLLMLGLRGWRQGARQGARQGQASRIQARHA